MKIDTKGITTAELQCEAVQEATKLGHSFDGCVWMHSEGKYFSLYFAYCDCGAHICVGRTNLEGTVCKGTALTDKCQWMH